MLRNIHILNKCCPAVLLSFLINPEKKCIMASSKILSCTTLFNMDNNQKYFLSSKSEWFLKDHVTLKTGDNDAGDSALIAEINYIFNIFK